MQGGESDRVSRGQVGRQGKEERQGQRESETVRKAGRLLSDTKQQKCNVLKGHRSQ